MTDGSFFGQPFPFVAPAASMTPVIDAVVKKVAQMAGYNLSIHRKRYESLIEEYVKSIEASAQTPASAGVLSDDPASAGAPASV